MEKTVEKFYIPSIKSDITIEYEFSNKKNGGVYTILQEKEVLQTATVKCCQPYYLHMEAYMKLIELFPTKEEIFAISYEDSSLIKLLESNYELLDKIEIIDEIDPSIGNIARYIYYEGKVIKLSTGITRVYTPRTGHCNIEFLSELRTLKET